MLEFTRDEFGQEVLLKDGKFQVMMEWEKPYMEACIDALASLDNVFGDVLEVGFGCGYSAARIQTYHPKSHTIIECDPVVAAHAREWAKNYPSVQIVEDTWQHALPSLGLFDVIFFDDYPLESEQEMGALKEKQTEARSFLTEGEKQMQELESQLSFLKEIQYTDEDIEFFFTSIKNENPDTKQIVRFFSDLEKKKNITHEQFKKIMEKFHIPESKQGAFQFQERGDRLFEFLEACLKNHMRVGSRFSCYLNYATSKYEDEKFFNHIITNPFLEYTEKLIPITVSPNCEYFQGNQALVITITKLK